MTISDKAVEAAAEVHYGKAGSTPWDDLAPMVRRIRLKKMRAALEAAAPHMLNLAKREAWDANLEIQRLRAELAEVSK